MLRAFPLHLALLGLIVGLTGCPSDDGPRAPDDSANPGPADDGTAGTPAPAPAKPGDGDGDSTTLSCEDKLAVCEAARTACETAGPK